MKKIKISKKHIVSKNKKHICRNIVYYINSLYKKSVKPNEFSFTLFTKQINY
jgi:hypothetical protein